MFHLLILAFLLAAGTASQDLEAEESVPPIQVYSLDDIHHHQDGHHQQKPHDVYLQNVRLHSGHKGQSKVDRIVTELNNPDYIEPITVLDYRYVKTGGRDYTRGAGGQILILPKHVRTNTKKEFANYDEMLEFLRLKQLAEIEAHHKEMSHLAYEHRQPHLHEHHIEVGRHQLDHHDYKQQHRASAYGYKRDAPEPAPQKEATP